jgi:hypothetical protein
MLGPMLLHWDGNMDSYHKFTSHLQAKLADIDQTNLIFGSDEEFAAVKAVHLSFPNATRVLCAKHLKDNAIVNLGKSLPQPEVTKIITKLFGESGILASEDQVTFDEIRDELTHSYDIPYLSNRLLPNLEQFAFKPRLRHPCLPRLCSREATHRFRTSNNAKSNPEIKGRNSILVRHDALQVSDHALFTSTPHVFLLNIFINKTERSIHFY